LSDFSLRKHNGHETHTKQVMGQTQTVTGQFKVKIKGK